MGKEEMYEGSDGTIMPISKVHTERLINSLAKCHREIYTSKTTQEFNDYINKICKLDTELTNRFNKYVMSLEEK